MFTKFDNGGKPLLVAKPETRLRECAVCSRLMPGCSSASLITRSAWVPRAMLPYAPQFNLIGVRKHEEFVLLCRRTSPLLTPGIDWGGTFGPLSRFMYL